MVLHPAYSVVVNVMREIEHSYENKKNPEERFQVEERGPSLVGITGAGLSHVLSYI